MAKLQFIPALAIALELSLSVALHAQNPPMNCTPDGIIEVCTLADTSSTPAAAEAVAPAAPVQPVPHVAYKDGQLTIIAENVPLSDVLHEVSRATGATLEVPAGSATERVFANIGPGSVRDVLVKLLNGTKFNYVMLGSQNTADRLQKIVLTPADQTTEAAQSEAPPSPLPAVEAAQSVASSNPLPAAFSSRKTQLPAATAQGAAPKSAEQRHAELVAQFEARKQAMMPILRQRYAEMMERAAAARASEQSSGSDSQAESSGSDSQAQSSDSGSQVQSSGSGTQVQPSGSPSPAQPTGSDSQAPQ